MAGPNAPSREKIKTEAQLEEERVKFENEKRLFIERVASYELISSQRLAAEGGTFESAPSMAPIPGSIQIPERFQASFDPTKFEQLNFRTDLSWFTAPNLGINYQQPEWIRPYTPPFTVQNGLNNKP